MIGLIIISLSVPQMKKKLIIILATAILCIAGIYIYHICQSPAGDTAASREEILNSSVQKGSDWSIVKETEIDNYIISAACNSDNMALLAVFEPESDKGYSFVNSTAGSASEIIISNTVIKGKQYNLIWFNGTPTEYAQVTYTEDGKKPVKLKFDTKNMDIICYHYPSDAYSMNVCYYDSDGNRYE